MDPENSWIDWNPNFYNLVIIDQLLDKGLFLTKLKMVLENKAFFEDRKYCNKKKTLIVKCPIIIISNKSPPECLVSKLYIVNSSHDGLEGI